MGMAAGHLMVDFSPYLLELGFCVCEHGVGRNDAKNLPGVSNRAEFISRPVTLCLGRSSRHIGVGRHHVEVAVRSGDLLNPSDSLNRVRCWPARMEVVPSEEGQVAIPCRRRLHSCPQAVLVEPCFIARPLLNVEAK